MASKNIKIIIEREKRKKDPQRAPWKFTIKAKNGLVLSSARGYNTWQNAHKTVRMLTDIMHQADVEIVHSKK